MQPAVRKRANQARASNTDEYDCLGLMPSNFCTQQVSSKMITPYAYFF